MSHRVHNGSHRPLAVLGLCLALALGAGCRKSQPPPASTATPAAAPAAAPITSAPAHEIESLTALATTYDKLQGEADQTNQRIGQVLASYQKAGGSLPPNFGSDLTPEQRKLLADKIAKEKANLKSLLQEALDKDTQVQKLKAQLQVLQGQLPAFVTAAEGSRHDRIAMDFLAKQGVKQEEAWRLVSQINLQDALLPGFHVWLYHAKGGFGTWVTKGSAPTSPQELSARIKYQLETERDSAVSTATGLKKEVQDLLSKREDLQKEVTSASAELDSVLTMLSKAQEQSGAAENVAHYAIGSKADLKSKGIISDSLLKGVRLRDLSAPESLDLRKQKQITVDAAAYGLAKVKKISFLPDVFRDGTDYTVTMIEGGSMAQIALINLEKFRHAKFVVVIE
jgi:hypothetical protein